MKKLILCAAIAALTALPSMAEGYQVNTLSARQNGMGHTGTALKLGAESQFFNPAGMAWMDNTVDFSANVTGIFSTATAKYNGKEYTTDSDPSTPLSAFLAFNVYDRFKVGVSVFTPYGSNINWTENWPGSILSQSVKLTMFTSQITGAYRILDNLSVGAGMTVTWGSVNLNKGLVTPASVDGMLAMAGNPYRFGETTPASVNLQGNATPRVGYVLGIMWDVTDQWSLGFNFRSRVDMKVKAGTATVNYANEMAKALMEQKLGLINQANFAAQMPAAATYRFGVAYKPIKPLTLAFDAQLTGWNAYKTLDIEFLSAQVAMFNQHITKNYRNAWAFHFGGEYKVTERFDVRAGLVVDTTPVRPEFYNPETPGMTKVEPSVGLSFRPIKQLSINASLLYVAGMGSADGTSCSYDNFLTQQRETFAASYNVHAWCPALGVSLQF